MKTKYNSKKVIVDGYTFDSQAEYEYFKILCEQKSKGDIKSFIVHPIYQLQEKFEKLGKNNRPIYYEGDFEITYNDNKIMMIDIKGMATPLSILKRKMFDYVYKDIELLWLSYVKKYGGWIEFDELKRLRKINKKEK